jgi:hypothetical protein
MILVFLAHGFNRMMMAKLLHANGYLTSDSMHTLKTYVERVYRKLRARNMGDAVRFAYYWKFLPPCDSRCDGCKAQAAAEKKGS